MTRTGADALGSVHCQPTGWMRGRIAHPTSWLASSGASVVIHSHVKTEHQRAPFPRTPRRGNGDQSDAQQVRAARQPHRLRLTRAHASAALPGLYHVLSSPLASSRAWTMDVCRAPSKASPKLCSAWLSRMNWADLDVREGRHARYDRWSVRRTAVGMPRSSADNLRRAPALLMLASRSTMRLE